MSNYPAAWTQIKTDEAGDAIVAAMALGDVEYLFFSSGSEIMFLQEAIAKARSVGRKAPKEGAQALRHRMRAPQRRKALIPAGFDDHFAGCIIR
jgi:hypothetical protein